MPGLLKDAPPSDAERAAHDRHDHRVVILALAVLAVFAYLFTHVSDDVGLLQPQELAEAAGLRVAHVFDVDGNVNAAFEITLNTQAQAARRAHRARLATNDDERLVFLGMVALAFLSAYYLPLRYKRGALVGLAALGIAVLFGRPVVGAFLGAHAIVYLVLHPDPYVPPPLRRWLLHERVGPVVRALAVHSAVIVMFSAAAVASLDGATWRVPAGLLLLFFQWQRLAMYHADYEDGHVPRRVSPVEYLSVFVSPAVVTNWGWGTTIGQGYHYLDATFYARDKNRIVLGGIRLLGIALLYLVLWNVVRHTLAGWIEAAGVPVFSGRNQDMLQHAAAGHAVGALSVLATSFLHLVRWTMIWAGVVHVKVGVWRLCGYDVDPYFDKPWLSTNLVTLWGRYTYHFREFLVRVFYYPFFFRFFRSQPTLRIMAATVFAVGLGNMLWHMTEHMIYRGPALEHALTIGSAWPYYVLLSLGIGLTQLYLHRVKRGRPWSSARRVPRDVLAAYATLQFYALLDILHQTDYAFPVRVRVFLSAFGIPLAP